MRTGVEEDHAKVLVASGALCLLLVGLVFLGWAQGWQQPDYVDCQIGKPNMYAIVVSADYFGKIVEPRHEFWLPPLGGCDVYYYNSPND